MSRHQLHLQGPGASGPAPAIDLEALKAQQISIFDAIGATDQNLEELRAQARALYEGGKWERCLEVVLGIAALGKLSLTDALMMPRCYRELGDHSSAIVVDRLVEEALVELDAELGRQGKAP